MQAKSIRLNGWSITVYNDFFCFVGAFHSYREKNLVTPIMVKSVIIFFLQDMKKVVTIDDVEAFLLKHGENIVDMLGGEIDRIELKLRVSKSIKMVRYVNFINYQLLLISYFFFRKSFLKFGTVI